MAFPDTALTSQWTDGEGTLNAATLYNRIDAQLNALRTRSPLCIRQVARASATTLNVPTATDTYVTLYDAGSTFNIGGITYAAGVLTVPLAGFYEWEFTVVFPSTTTQHTRGLFISVNSAAPPYNQGRDFRYFNGTVGARAMTASGRLPLAAGAQVQAGIYQDSGGTLAVAPGAFTVALLATG